MSKETKNPLIESFLKLHEYAAAPRPDKLFGAMSPPPQSGVKVNLPGPSSVTSPTAAPPVANASPSTSAFKANMGQPSQGTSDGSAYQPRTFDQKVSDVQKNYSINPVGTKTSNLRVGSSGDQVSYVQRQLGVDADKQYGDDTKKAVIDFQKRNNLKVDGIVGDQTLSALKRAEAMGKLQMSDKAGSAAKETQKFAGPPSGSAAPIKTAPTNFSGGRTGFSGNAGNIKTASSSNLVGPGSRANKPLYSVSDKPYDLSGQVNKPDLISTGLAGKTLPGNDANERSIYVQKRLRNLASARSSGSFLTQGDNTEMSNKLIEAFMKLQSLNTSNIFEAAKKAKKLDPVGKEDEDIDNDGDKDKTDSYLHNRRKKIADAMKEDVTSPSSMRIKAPSYAKPNKEKEEGPSPKGDLPADVAKSMEREREINKESGEPGSRQRSMNDSAKDAANRAGGARSVEAIAKGVGAVYGQGIAKVVDAVAGYKKPESKVYQNTGKSSIALKNEEVEYIDEAAVPDSHKQAMIKKYGRGRVTAENGKISHKDGYGETNSHAYDPTSKQPIGRHVGKKFDPDDLYPGKRQNRFYQDIDEETLDEAAGGLPAEHKKAIANHVKKMWGKGTVTFDKQDGKHFVTHNDGIESQVHSIHMKGGKAHVTHFMTVQEEVEQIDEILDRPGKELGYALKNIGSKLKAGLTGDKNTVRKRERGEKSFKKNAAKKKDEREMDSYRNKLAGKALRDMGQKTGLGMYYDKIHKEEVEQINEDEMYKAFMQTVHTHAKTMSPKKFGKEYPSMAKHQETIAKTPRKDVHRLKVDKDGQAFMHVGVKEEVEFSEAELAHMAAILEGPVAPTPDDYSPNAFGSTASRSGTLTDEAIAEEEARRGRGRPKGSKSGSKHGSGSGTTGGVTHVVDQIRNAEKLGLSDGKGNYKLKHITGYTTSKVDGKTVSTPKTMEFSAPQKAANDFYKAFHGTEKPAHKESMTKAFVEKHSGKSLDPANTNKITLPKI